MDDLVSWALKGLIGVVMTIGAFITKNLHTEVVKLRDKQSALDNDLRDHKLESEKRYAREETLQTSLARVHARIDTMDVRINDKLDRIYQNLVDKT